MLTSKIKMPKLGDTIDSVLVLEILVAPGDVIETGHTLMLVETDKVTAEVPAPMPGRITEVLVTVGTEVEVGTPIVVLASD